MIQAEGVESLSEEELRQACRERGHLGLLSTEEMRQQVGFALFPLYAYPHNLFTLLLAGIICYSRCLYVTLGIHSFLTLYAILPFWDELVHTFFHPLSI